MARKLSGKKRFGRTKAGKRAIAGARSGRGGLKNPDGTRSSVRSTTVDIPGKKGRTDVALIPTIRKMGGKLVRLSSKAAVKTALSTGDFVRIKGGKTKKAVAKARAKGASKSRKFSAKLGKISKRVTRKKKKR